MKRSFILSAALAVACLAGLSASVNAQPVDPAPAFRMSTAAADTRAQSVQTVSASEQTAGAVYLVTDAASHKPAHGGYPGAVKVIGRTLPPGCPQWGVPGCVRSRT